MKFAYAALSTIFLLLVLNIGNAQNVVLEGYAYEENNRGYLNEVKIMVLKLPIKSVVAKDVYTNMEGKFEVSLPAGEDYLVRATKDIFQTNEVEISTKGKDSKVYVKLEMIRKPGYLFEATLAEKRTNPDQEVDAIQGSLIEIYNNTTEEEEMILENHPDPAFSFTFEQGNHYTIMVRKDGYLAKRIEAYVNINGCIVCIDGVRQAGPGVVDVLTHGFEMGTLLANIELDAANLNTTIAVDKIYYDLSKWDIHQEAAKELDKVIILMNDNPDIIVELGSHTDSRGSSEFNQELSQKRADAAVAYITRVGNITTDRISSKGYGESKLVNSCGNGVECSEARHQRNRRTELKITGFKAQKRAWKSLQMIIREEKFSKESGDFTSGVIKIGEDGTAIRSKPKKLKIDDLVKGKTLPKVNSKNEVPKVKQHLPKESIQPKPNTSKISEDEKMSKALTILEEAKLIESPATRAQEVLVTRGTSGVNVKAQVQITPQAQVQKQVEAPNQIRPKTQTQVEQETEISMEDIEPQTSVETQYVHHLLPINYSGFKVEVLTSPSELTAEHPVFHDFGPVTVERVSDGGFAYLLGDFTSERIGVYFLNNSIIDDYSTAKLVEYKNGKRVFR